MPAASRPGGGSATAWVVVLLMMGMAAGCATSVTPASLERARSLPERQREAVAAWLINSPLDPLQVTGIAELARGLRRAGYDVETLAAASGGSLAKRVREAHGEGRVAALIAWSGASLWVHDALTELDAAGERVELVVYLDSNWIKGRIKERGHPTNADRVALVYRRNNPFPAIPGAARHEVDELNHLAVPRRREAATAVLDELTRLAGGDEGEAGRD